MGTIGINVKKVASSSSMGQLARYFQFQPGKLVREDGVFIVYVPPSMIPKKEKEQELVDSMGIFIEDVETNRKENRRGVYEDILSSRKHEGRGTYQWVTGKNPADVSGGFSPDMKQMIARYLSQNPRPTDNYDLAQELGDGTAKVPHNLVQKALNELKEEGFIMKGSEKSAVIDYGKNIFGSDGAELFEAYMEPDWKGRKIDSEAQARAKAVLNCRVQELSATNAIRELALDETLNLIEGGFNREDIFAEDLSSLIRKGQLGLAYTKIVTEIGRLERLYDPKHIEHLEELRDRELPRLQAAVGALEDYANREAAARKEGRRLRGNLSMIKGSLRSAERAVDSIKSDKSTPPQYLEDIGYALTHLSETVEKAVRAQEVRTAGVLPAVLRLKPLIGRLAELVDGKEPPGKLKILNDVRKAVAALDSVYGIRKGFYTDAQGLFDRSFILRHFNLPEVQGVISGMRELGEGMDSVEVYVLRGIGKVEKHRGVMELHSVSEAEAAVLGDFGGRAHINSSEMPPESLHTVESLLLALDEPGFPYVIKAKEQIRTEEEKKK
ncbi:MAG: hypothetical protein HY362_02915 [Candidatus Aenigmarchaeota archaeon]|nr:hypothetical protein [Candidatus Aenigmarchaeota archaeon]